MVLDEPTPMGLCPSSPVISSEVVAAGLLREITCFFCEGWRGGLTGMAAPTAIGNGTLSRLRRRTHTRELVDTEKF